MQNRIDTEMKATLDAFLQEYGHGQDQLYTIYEDISNSAQAFFGPPQAIEGSPADLAFKRSLSNAADYLLKDYRPIKILVALAATRGVLTSAAIEDQFLEAAAALEADGQLIPTDPVAARQLVFHGEINSVVNYAMQYFHSIGVNPPSSSGPGM